MAIRRTGTIAPTTQAPENKSSASPTRPAVVSSNATRASTTVESKLTHDQIAKAAYFLWIEKGRPSGRDAEIWCEAEKRLVRK